MQVEIPKHFSLDFYCIIIIIYMMDYDEKKEGIDNKIDEKEEGDSISSVQTEKETEEEGESPDTLNLKVKEYYDNWLRTLAEFENYKKRVQKEKADFYNYGYEPILKSLIEIKDNFDRALNFKQDNINNVELVIEGVNLIYKQFVSLLEKYGVTPIKAVGERFDPFYHEAVEYREEDGEQDVIVEEFQKGYMYKNRLLRPSLVCVRKVKAINQEKKQYFEHEKDEAVEEEKK